MSHMSNNFLTLNTDGVNYPIRGQQFVSLAGAVNSISAINELSTGLTLAMDNASPFISSYQGVVSTQARVLNSSITLGESLSGGTLNINNFIGTTVGPLSGAIAGVGLATLNANKLYQVGSIGVSSFASAQKISDLCLDVVEKQQNVLFGTLNRIEGSGVLQAGIDSMVSSKIISSGVNTVLRSLPTYPTDLELPNLETVYEIGEITEKELSEHQEKLDILLLNIDPSLVEYRKACWETFKKKGKDYIGQSSSSMRRLVDDVLRILAPNEKVLETDFFKNSPVAKDQKGKPTRKARVYHIVRFDEQKAEHLERLVRGFLEAYDNLPAWDHKPIQQDSFVYGVFITIEGYLISMLSEN